ncbi:Transposase [Sulfidibacter corallicola]
MDPMTPFPYQLELIAFPDSDFAYAIDELLNLLNTFPEILERLEADLDRHALVLKQARLNHRRACAGTPHLPGLDDPDPLEAMTPSELKLGIGRRRMSAQDVLFCLICRYFLDGVKSVSARGFFAESRTVARYFSQQGRPCPAGSTITHNVNLVSQATLDLVLDRIITTIRSRNLDDFAEVTLDSTAVRGNTAWPADSELIAQIARSLHRGLCQPILEDVATSMASRIDVWCEDIEAARRSIGLASGKGAKAVRQHHYGLMIDAAEYLSQEMGGILDHLATWEHGHRPGSRGYQRWMEWQARMTKDVSQLDSLIHTTCRRVIEQEKVGTAERVLSVADPSIAWIEKGGREPEVGYRVQIAKSARQFVVAVSVPEGNPMDASMFQQTCRKAFERIGTTPATCSADDGYASKANQQWLARQGVQTKSFSGAKGKKIAGEEAWESKPYREARRMRSSVEGLIGQLKALFGFGRVWRRGLEAVKAELTGKAIVYNLYRLQQLVQTC